VSFARTSGAIAAVMVAACAKREAHAPVDCPPLVVTIDGVTAPALPHGLARLNVWDRDRSYEVHRFSHAEVTCEHVLKSAAAPAREGELHVRAYAGGSGLATGQGVGIDAHTQMGARVVLVGAPPAAVGDAVRLCARGGAFTPIVGAYQGRRVEIRGLLEGTYCGEHAR
jgi:hypothetical protein